MNREKIVIQKLIKESNSQTLDEILTHLGKWYKADRAYIFEDDPAKGTSSNTYEWCAKGVIPEIDNLQDLDLSEVKETEEMIKNGEFVIHSLEDELEKDSPLYKILAPQDIHSIILVPLMLGNQAVGYIGVDNPKENIDMTLLLSVASTVIGSKILYNRRLAFNDESFAVLSKLREQYVTMYYADLETDYMHTYKTNDNYGEKYGDTQCYSKSMGDYVKYDVAQKDRERMIEATEAKNVIERFKTEDSFVLDFEDHSFGDIRYCQFRFIKADETGERAVILGSDLTKEKKEEKAVQDQIREQLQIIDTLGSEYENLYLINVETKTYKQYHRDESGIHSEALSLGDQFENYEDGLQAYFKAYAPQEEQEYLLEQANTEALLEKTPDKGIYSLNYTRVSGDEKLHYQLNTAKFTGDNGIKYLVLGFRDIEEIVQEERRKSQALEEMQDIISASEMGTWHIELVEGKEPRMSADARMMELLGLSSDNMSPEEIYKAWFERIKPEAVQSVLDSVAKMELGQRDENTYLWIHPTLGERYVRCGGTSRVIEGGFILRGYHYDVDDIVREQQKQEQLVRDALHAAEHANNVKTTFLNNMSHDIRTPMNAIIGYTALAASHADNKEQVQDYLSKINVSSNHLLSLINDVLDMSRIDSGKVSIDAKEVYLPDILHDIRTITVANIHAKQIDFFMDTEDVVHENIICDKLRLNQILLNILSNATKFTKPGGSIGVRVVERPSKTEGHALYEFHIKDTGIGMSEEFQEHIFEPFTREQSSTVSGTPGTGLGMAICKTIVDMMNGTIEVKSKVGQGTEFIVSLDFETSGTPVRCEIIPQLQGVRALVADDNSGTAICVSNMLKSIGMRSDWTLSGKEAVLRAKVAYEEKDEYGAYIIDWLMPDMNGIETVRQIRRYIGEYVPIIILTAYDWADIEDEARAAGVTGFASKPIFLSELKEVLSQPFKKVEEAQELEEIDYTGKKILLVEDNQMNQEIAEEILSSYGLEVETAGDGDVAVEMLRNNDSYDLVFMDIQMPTMNGYEATLEIRTFSEIPIVAMSANAFDEDRIMASKAGMNGYITKPIDFDKLKETLEKYLR